MSNENEIKCYQKHFASCKIEWKIENFLLAIRPGVFCIRSPEFALKAVHLTKWRIYMDVKQREKEDGYVVVGLERLLPYDPEKVKVDGEITAFGKKKVKIPFQGDFQANEKNEIYTERITKVIEELPLFPDDIVEIHFCLIVDSRDVFFKGSKSSTHGLRCLSEDIQKLEKLKKFKDVKLRFFPTGDQYQDIEAHKAILSRNKVLENLMKNSNDDVIELRSGDYSCALEFVRFLYSGNMDSILNDASITMGQCVDYFGNDILKCYYAAEELNMHSRIKAEVQEFQWHAKSLSNETNVISSPPIKSMNFNTIWQLHLDTSSDNEWISMSVEVIEGRRPLHFYLEFTIEDIGKGELVPISRILSINVTKDEIRVEKFLKTDKLNDSNLYIDDTLRIILKIVTAFDADPESKMKCRMMSFVTCTEEPSYEQMSAEMAELLEKSEYSDITLNSRGKSFKAHKCILSVRSNALSKAIKKNEDTHDLDIDPTVLQIVLHYIYSGVLKDLQIPQLFQVCSTADTDSLNIPSLKEECLISLRRKVNDGQKDAVLSVAQRLGRENIINLL